MIYNKVHVKKSIQLDSNRVQNDYIPNTGVRLAHGERVSRLGHRGYCTSGGLFNKVILRITFCNHWCMMGRMVDSLNVLHAANTNYNSENWRSFCKHQTAKTTTAVPCLAVGSRNGSQDKTDAYFSP